MMRRKRVGIALQQREAALKRLTKAVIRGIAALLLLCVGGLLLFYAMCGVSIKTRKTEISGIENYHPSTCSLGLTGNLYPGEDFLSRFAYAEGEYYYNYDRGDAVAFSILKYSPEQYEAAKEYCLQQFTLTDEHQYQVGGYEFAEHLCYTSENENGQWLPACKYPKHFNMYGYHDQECSLVFLGYYNSEKDHPDKVLAESDFAAFLTNVYSEYYDFCK